MVVGGVRTDATIGVDTGGGTVTIDGVFDDIPLSRPFGSFRSLQPHPTPFYGSYKKNKDLARPPTRN